MGGMIGEADVADAPADRLGPALRRAGTYLLLISLSFFFLFPRHGFTAWLFRSDDFPALLIGGGLLLVLSFCRFVLPVPRLPRPSLLAAGLALAVLLLTAAGTWLVFGGFAMTRDEILADFDAAFLAHGLLIAPIPAPWRAFSAALMPRFMLPVSSGAGWLSSYLPGNAAVRALAKVTVGAEWTNPILAALSALALYRIGRRLWPDARDAALVAVLLLTTSAQLLAMAMTPYAMTAHLAFNLLWLWAFLRDDRRGDAGAIAAGFVATGLHQLVFHPLFVFPFIVHLWVSGRRSRAIVYVAAYGAIGLFWSDYWQLVLAGTATGAGQTSTTGLVYLLARLFALLGSMQLSGLVTMSFNVLRFLSWQNLLLLPLVLLGAGAVRRAEGIARPLAAGIVLTLLVMLALLPWQGLGWGYRYLHGLIGSCCLLASYGWRRIGTERPWRNAILAAGTGTSLLVILPLHLKQAHDLVAPYRQAYALITRSKADIVLVEPAGVLLDDLVRNAPDLSNRPKIMNEDLLSEAQLRYLCTHYRVEIFDIRHGLRSGITSLGGPLPPPSGPSLARRIGCGSPLPFE
jgi:hypothetical protein